MQMVVSILGAGNVHMLAVAILDNTDTAIIRFVVDDPEKARALLLNHGLPFADNELVVVELASATDLGKLMTTLLEAEVNINYLYTFIPHPRDKALLAISTEDNDTAENALARHRFQVLLQSDVSR
jgi:hypothetical protein